MGSLAVGNLEPEPGYSAIRDLVRAASRSLWSVGFLASGESAHLPQRPPLDVVARAAELELELFDEMGVLLPTDFINIVEREDGSLPPAVFVRLRLDRARRPAIVPTSPTSGSTHSA